MHTVPLCPYRPGVYTGAHARAPPSMDIKQLTLLDPEECRHDEEALIRRTALDWAKGDHIKAIAWVERAATRLDEEHERSVRVWETKHARHIALGYPEEGFKTPKPGSPRAKHAMLARIKASLQAEA